MTTAENLTDEQITALSTEAVAHGDHLQVIICASALRGDEMARRQVAATIRVAEGYRRD